MNWLLLIVLGILIVNSFIGMKTGLIKTVFSLFSMMIAVALTVWLSPYVNNYMRGNETLCNSINTKVEKILPQMKDKSTQSEQVSTIEGLKLPQSIKDSLIENNNSDIYKQLSVRGFKAYVRSYLTGIIINALAFSVTFVVSLALIWVISMALGILSMLPILHQVNKLSGLAAGLVQGLVVVWIVFIILTVLQSTQLGQKAMEMIGKDQILSLIYDNNILLGFVTNAAKMLF
jgi:uncharacterized membrane protein required for colicin V production